MIENTFDPMFAALLDCRADQQGGHNSGSMDEIAKRYGVDALDLCRHWGAMVSAASERQPPAQSKLFRAATLREAAAK